MAGSIPSTDVKRTKDNDLGNLSSSQYENFCKALEEFNNASITPTKYRSANGYQKTQDNENLKKD